MAPDGTGREVQPFGDLRAGQLRVAAGEVEDSVTAGEPATPADPHRQVCGRKERMGRGNLRWTLGLVLERGWKNVRPVPHCTALGQVRRRKKMSSCRGHFRLARL